MHQWPPCVVRHIFGLSRHADSDVQAIASGELTADVSAGETAKTRSGRRRGRVLWLAVHKWIGLSAGALLLLIGLTGSILVFHLEIDEWLNPRLFEVAPRAGGESAYRPLDEWVEAARTVLPPGGRLTFAQYPRHDGVSVRFNALVPSKPGDSGPSNNAVYHVAVDPYRAEVTGVRLVRPAGWAGAIPRTFIGFVFALHYALLLPRFGEPPFGDTVVAILGLILILSLGSGIVLWWPRASQWRGALTIRYPAHPRRLNFDLHKTAGVYFLLVLLGLFLSGVYLNLRAPFHAVVRMFSPTIDRYAVRSQAAPGGQSITLSQAMQRVRERFPIGRPEWLYLPRNERGTYTVCQRDVPGISALLTRRCVVLDQYSGEILHVESPQGASAGQHFIQWQWPIHSGQLFGLAGRWIVFLSGLVCPLLFGTGWYLWWRKRRGVAGRAA